MVGTGPPSSSSSSMFTAWIAAMSRIDFTNSAATAAAAVNSTSSSDSMPEVRVSEGHNSAKDSDNQAVGYSSAQLNLGFRERAFSAAGAAFLSAIIVNPLDVVEFRRECKPRQLVPPIIHTPMRTSERPWRLSEKNTELELDKFVTDKVSFADINKAFDHMLKGEGLRTVIKVIQD